MGIVDVKQTGEHELMLEWESSASNDMAADSTLALITGIDKSPASAKREHIPSSLCPLQRPPSCSEFTLERFVGRGCLKMARYPNADDKRSSQSCFPFYFSPVTSNPHSHIHEHVHPHADSESDQERVQRLAMFLESHFGEVHMNVPEPEKGHEEDQDEEVPGPVLLIRLDEADALVHLRSMVSRRPSVYSSLPFLFTFLPQP
jgi:cleavage and polyadenylation specificity factor subunit 3